MIYDIELSRTALKSMSKIPKRELSQIKERIEALSSVPSARDVAVQLASIGSEAGAEEVWNVLQLEMPALLGHRDRGHHSGRGERADCMAGAASAASRRRRPRGLFVRRPRRARNARWRRFEAGHSRHFRSGALPRTSGLCSGRTRIAA